MHKMQIDLGFDAEIKLRQDPNLYLIEKLQDKYNTRIIEKT